MFNPEINNKVVLVLLIVVSSLFLIVEDNKGGRLEGWKTSFGKYISSNLTAFDMGVGVGGFLSKPSLNGNHVLDGGNVDKIIDYKNKLFKDNNLENGLSETKEIKIPSISKNDPKKVEVPKTETFPNTKDSKSSPAPDSNPIVPPYGGGSSGIFTPDSKQNITPSSPEPQTPPQIPEQNIPTPSAPEQEAPKVDNLPPVVPLVPKGQEKVTYLTSNYFVDPLSGNDSNSGLSKEEAWKTIPGTEGKNKWGQVSSVNKIGAGTIIEIKAGSIINSSNAARLVIDDHFYESGDSVNPIIIRASNDWGSGDIVFDASNMNIPKYTAAISVDNLNYVHIKGSNVSKIIEKNADGGGWGFVAYGRSQKHSEGVLIDRMSFENNSFGGVSFIYTDNFLASNIISHHNAFIGFEVGGINDQNSDGGKFVDVEAFANGVGQDDIAHGFGLYGSTNITYERAKSHNNGRDGFDMGSVSNSNNASAIFKDAQSYDNGEDGFGINSGPSGSVSATYIDSVAYNNEQAGWDIYDGPRVILLRAVAHNNGTESFGGNILTYSNSDGVPAPEITIKDSIFYKPKYAQFGSYTGIFAKVTSSNNIFIPRSSNEEVFSESPFGTTQSYSKPPSFVSGTDKVGIGYVSAIASLSQR